MVVGMIVDMAGDCQQFISRSNRMLLDDAIIQPVGGEEHEEDPKGSFEGHVGPQQQEQQVNSNNNSSHTMPVSEETLEEPPQQHSPTQDSVEEDEMVKVLSSPPSSTSGSARPLAQPSGSSSPRPEEEADEARHAMVSPRSQLKSKSLYVPSPTKKRDPRYSVGNGGLTGLDDMKDRFGEYGIIGAEQQDESYYDRRLGGGGEVGGRHSCADGPGDAADAVAAAASAATNAVKDERVETDDEEDDDDEVEEMYDEKGRIKFSQKQLYGRQKELLRLHEIHNKMRHNSARRRIKEESKEQERAEGDDIESSSSSSDSDSGCIGMAFISGYSGCGKSSLVNEFVQQVGNKDSGGIGAASVGNDDASNKNAPLFLQVKFESMSQSSPFSAFGRLFDGFKLKPLQPQPHSHHNHKHNHTHPHHSYDDASSSVDASHLAIQRRFLEETLGDDAAIILKIFPSLQRSLGFDDNGSISTSSRNLSSTRSISSYLDHKNIDKTRLKFIFTRLFQSLCMFDENRSLIMFVDDLQWADAQSLELLQSLLTHEGMSNFMFLGAYRSNEVADDQHPIHQKLLNKLQATTDDGLLELMKLHDLSKGDVETFLADTLHLEKTEVEPLSEAIFTKTLGNPFFTIQALEQLVRQNVVYYDTMIFTWSWNLQPAQLEKLLSSDIIDMVKSKISDMSETIQRALIVASYVRSTFDAETLLSLLILQQQRQEATYRIGGPVDWSLDSLLETLEEAVVEGLLVNVDRDNANSSSAPSEYSFAHDKIQEAASSMISEGSDRDEVLTMIGDALAKRGADGEVGEDWMIYTAAHHLNSVSSNEQHGEFSLRHGAERRLELANLNLKAGKLSMGVLALSSAADYVKHGIANLPKNMSNDMLWSEHFELVLDLYSVGAQAEKGIGNAEKAEEYCRHVLDQDEKTGRITMMDKIECYKVQLDILAGKNEKAKALELALKILSHLGCSFPKQEKLQRVMAWTSLQKTKSNGIPTEDDIAEMPYVADRDIIDKMDLLEKAGSFAYSVNMVPLYVLLRCKWIRWMNKHGLTELSGGAVASFANILTHVYGDYKVGPHLAEVAMLIQKRLNIKYTEPRALNTSNMNVLGWVRPLRTRFRYHQQAYEAGMISGNIEGAYVGKMYSYWVHLYSAMPLAALDEDCRTHIPKMRKQGHNFLGDLCCSVWQSALNLLGKSNNTYILTGDVMDEEVFLKKPFKHSIALRKSFMFVYFGEWELGAEDALERGDSYTKAFVGAGYGFEPFYRGICLYAMARKTGLSKFKKPAQKVRTQLREWVKKGCINLIPLAKLLDAEAAVLANKNKKAQDLFEESTKCATEGGFHQNAGLACERYAVYLMESGMFKEAIAKLADASNHYSRWGATKKVELLQKEMKKISKNDKKRKSSPF